VQRRDLLSSDRTGRNFVVETEDDGRAYLRFGFGTLGKEPTSTSTLLVSYRTGNGSKANVGRHAIAHIVGDTDGLSGKIARVRNPLPVTSGIDLEPIDTARLAAPYAFQNHLSCIHPDDYTRLAQQFPGGDVLRAAAQIERTGNWQTVFVYAQRAGGRLADRAFGEQLLAWLQPLAMSGYEVAVRSPRYVDLELHLRVRVAPGRFKNAVRQAVSAALGNGLLADGSPAYFNPDTLAFGQSLYRSQVIRAAMVVDGVEQAEIVRFGRLDDARSLDPLPIGELEIARLTTDPGRPESSRLRIDMEGGA
jgi:predicted phage baseplate assembly protein